MILVDTNVLLYIYENNEPLKQQRAEQVLEQLERTGQGRLSVQCLAEFFSVATRKLKPPITPAKAYEYLSLFVQTWLIFDLTPAIVLEAVRGVRDHQLAYYDAQLWAMARLNQIPIIFSEDFSNNRIIEGVRFVNPFTPSSF
jgi:predicted nucleic acid-binding protein